MIGYINDDAHNGDGAEHLHMGIRLSDKATAISHDSAWYRGYNNGSMQYLDFASAQSVVDIVQHNGIEELCMDLNGISFLCWNPSSASNVECRDAERWTLY
ncbi:hypothetical protein GMJAKD_07370 [Candidatus Electrothrix aarhusensis]